MHTILAIETSSELASAALLHNGQTIANEASGAHAHSQTLLPMVQKLLAQAGIMLAQCDAIAFGAGPGSFTGVRTACGVAQGLAFGADLPVVPVVTLQAMAQACRDACSATEVLALLDARMGEVYWAQYRYQDGWQTVAEPALSVPSEITVDRTVFACGNGLIAYASVFSGLSSIKEGWPDVVPHAVQIARLAQAELAAGHVLNARDVQPIYLRNKVALTTAERLSKVAS